MDPKIRNKRNERSGVVQIDNGRTTPRIDEVVVNYVGLFQLPLPHFDQLQG